jgi:hypothetical protein
MSHLLDTVFNFLLIYVLLFPQQRVGLSASKYNNLYLSMFEESPKGVDPKVNSRSYSGTESSSTGALSLAWISTQNDCIKIKKKKKTMNYSILDK